MKNIAKTEKIKNSKERLKGIIMGRKSNVLVLEKHILKGRCCEYHSITFYPKRKKKIKDHISIQINMPIKIIVSK